MVHLVRVDDVVLELLVHVAVADAGADDVTPLSRQDLRETPERIAWLREYHHRCRAGLRGPVGEATWAVLVGEEMVGSVRLETTDQYGVVETGIWLTHSARGRGVGAAALTALLREALALGSTEVQARTTTGNAAAQRLLLRLGFRVAASDDGVVGVLELHGARSRPS